MDISVDFKNKVVAAVLEKRERFDGSDAAFAKSLGISAAIFSRIKSGEREKILKDVQWLQFARELGIAANQKKWKMARTDVFNVIEEDVKFCQEYSKAMICVDDVGIGKSYAAKYLALTLKNCFYVDGKQAKSKQAFIRLIAKTVGLDNKGRYTDVKENLKYYLQMLPKPMIIIDDSGYLDYSAYMELLELWDATEGVCGWYQIGDDALRQKIERGINNKKVGYKAIFSRYSKRYTTITPTDKAEKQTFYKKLITDVLKVNMDDQQELNTLVKQCLITDMHDSYGDLRRAESLLKAYNSSN
jgi:hypothetical protein